MEINPFKKKDDQAELSEAELEDQRMIQAIGDKVVEAVKNVKEFRQARLWPPAFTQALPYFAVPSTASPAERTAAYERNERIYRLAMKSLSIERHRELSSYQTPLIGVATTTEEEKNGVLNTLTRRQVGSYGFVLQETVYDEQGHPADFWAEFKGPTEAAAQELRERGVRPVIVPPSGQ